MQRMTLAYTVTSDAGRFISTVPDCDPKAMGFFT